MLNLTLFGGRSDATFSEVASTAAALSLIPFSTEQKRRTDAVLTVRELNLC